MKTTAVEKGRGDTGSEMWNQVLLGNGSVEEQWSGPIPPLLLITSFAPTQYTLSSSISLFLNIPFPDLTLLYCPAPKAVFPSVSCSFSGVT